MNPFFSNSEKIKNPTEKRIAVGFAVNVVVLLVIAFVLYRIDMNIHEKNRLISKHQEFLDHTIVIQNVTNDVKNRARDFIITGDENILGKNFPIIYLRSLHFHIKELYLLTEYNRQEEKQEKTLDTLEDIVDKNVYAISEDVTIRKQKGFEAAINSLIEGKNKQTQLMNKINETITRIQKNEDDLFRQNLIKNETQTLILVLVGLLSLMLVLLIIVYFILRNNLKARQKAEALSCDKEHFFKSIIDNTANNIAIKHITGYYIYINKQFEKSFHLANEQITGKNDYEIFPKETAKVLRSGDIDVLKEGKGVKIEEHIPLEDGLHTFLAIKFPLYNDEGKIYAIGEIATDITERKQLEVLILEEDLRLKSILASIGEGVIVVDTNRRIILSNKMASEILGFEDLEKLPKIDDWTETIDVFYSDGTTPFPFEDRPLVRALKGEPNNDVQMVVHYKKKSGAKDRLISNTGRPVRNEKGEIIAAVSVLRDITKYKELEEELEESKLKYRKLIGYKSQEAKFV